MSPSDLEGGMGVLRLRSRNPFSEIEILDGSLKSQAQGSGELEATLTPGIYEVQYRLGGQITRDIVKLEAGQVVEQLEHDTPITTVSPLSGSVTLKDVHTSRAREATRRLTNVASGEGEVLLFVRDVPSLGGKKGVSPITPETLAQLDLRAPSGDIVPQFHASGEQSSDEGWGSLQAAVAVGGYTISRRSAEANIPQAGSFEQSVWVVSGWTTLVFVPNRRTGPAPDLAAIHMLRQNEEWDIEDPARQEVDAALEAALAALRQGRGTVSRSARRLLLGEKAENPLLGIVAAQLLLNSEKTDWDLFDEVISHLVALIPGHPDVAALHAVGRHLRKATPTLPDGFGKSVEWPPMLLACYRGLLECDSAAPDQELIAEGSPADIAAERLIASGTWTTWQRTDPIQDETSTNVASFGSTLRQFQRNLAQTSELLLGSSGVKSAEYGWRRFIRKGIPTSGGPELRRYLGERVKDTKARSLEQFVKALNVTEVSRATGLPPRSVRRAQEELLGELGRTKK